MFLSMLTPSKALSILTPVATGKKFSVSELGTDVINYISHATQQRLQDILEKVSRVAQQKNLTFKVIIDCNCRVGETHSLLCFKISCFIFLSVLAFHANSRKMNSMSRRAMCEHSSNSLSSWIKWRSKGRKSRRERSS